jgi:hypothetical protein
MKAKNFEFTWMRIWKLYFDSVCFINTKNRSFSLNIDKHNIKTVSMHTFDINKH